MKLATLLIVPFLISPVQASENIGERSNADAYRDAQVVRNDNWFTRTYYPPERSHRPYRRWRTSNSYQPGYSSSSTCTRKEYREEYVPGTANQPGYVKSWHDTIEVPCRPWRSSPPREHREPRPIYQRPPSPDGNECSDGAVLGGILGGGAAAALSQGDGRWWAIPLGIVGGSVIGCDIDGG